MQNATHTNISRGTYERRPDEATWGLIERTAKHIWTSGAAETMKFKNESSVVLVLLKGWELGLPLMSSLEHVRMIHGRFSLSAECQQALVLARVPGAKFDWKSDGKGGVAEVVASRPGQAPVTVRFTMEDAQKTGLAERNPLFKTYPGNLLRSSAMRHACKRLFPDIVLGVDLGTDEEEVELPAHATHDAEPAEVETKPITQAVQAPAASRSQAESIPNGLPVPEDHKLPFTDGQWAGICLSDLRVEDFAKMVRGFSTRLAKATEEGDDKRIKANEVWLQRVKSWAAYRQAPTE